MKNWMQHPIHLVGKNSSLQPLEEKHFAALYAVAKEERIWQYLPSNCSIEKTFIDTYQNALLEREKGSHYPFVIINNANDKIIGSTRFFDIHAKDKNLEIGWTWLHPNYWASGINLECKLLLLTYCFETLKTIRVQLKTSDTNIRSRKAIEKLGATQEGIHRKDRIRDNGEIRNSVYYSIIDDEWERVKANLIAKISLLNV